MPIVDILSVNKTREEEVKSEAQRIAEFNANVIEFLIDRYKVSFDYIWRNPKATPQEIFNAYGIQSKSLFLASDATIEYIKLFRPDYVAPSVPCLYMINDDGTVNVQ